MEILRNINKNIIDITNANNDIDTRLLKDNIKLYFDNISDKENISNKKREKYYENYENKRVEQNINYDNWLREKTDLMETFKLDKTKTALHNYLKLKPPKYNNNLNLYSYLDIIIDDEKVINMPKQQNIQPIKPKVLPSKADKCPESKKKECKDKGKKCNPDSGRCIKDDKPDDDKPVDDKQDDDKQDDDKPADDKPADNKPVDDKPADDKQDDDKQDDVKQDDDKQDDDKCTEAKKKECKDKGKICNPESGRCIKEPVVKQVVKPKVAPVVKQDVEPKVAPVVKQAIKSDKCSEAKKKECEIKGKKCNPDSGRCIKK